MIVGAFRGRVSSRTRFGFYALATAAAALFIAVIVLDAGAIGLTEQPKIQRATMW